MFDDLGAALASKPGAYVKLTAPSHTFVKLFDSSEIRDVINKMLVKQTKMNIKGGPSIGEICHVHQRCVALRHLPFLVLLRQHPGQNRQLARKYSIAIQ